MRSATQARDHARCSAATGTRSASRRVRESVNERAAAMRTVAGDTSVARPAGRDGGDQDLVVPGDVDEPRPRAR